MSEAKNRWSRIAEGAEDLDPAQRLTYRASLSCGFDLGEHVFGRCRTRSGGTP